MQSKASPKHVPLYCSGSILWAHGKLRESCLWAVAGTMNVSHQWTLISPSPEVFLIWNPLDNSVQFCSVAQSCLTLCDPMNCSMPPCPSPAPGVYSNSCLLSRWCHPAILSFVIPFSSRLQSLPASESFPVSQLFTSGGQSIGVSASASVLPMNTQEWSTLGWTGWISLQSKGLSRVFSNITVQKHQLLGAQLSV